MCDAPAVLSRFFEVLTNRDVYGTRSYHCSEPRHERLSCNIIPGLKRGLTAE